jgi:hypothetical protein
MLFMPALLFFIALTSLRSGVLWLNSSSVDRNVRPTAFAFYITAMILFALLLLGLACVVAFRRV